MATNAAVPQLSLGALSPGRDLDAYMRVVGSFPILSAEEERALAERFYHHNDLEAARQLVLGHLRFVVHLARSYHGYGLPLGDLIQEGNVGLMKAVKRFDPNVGVRLISFAVHWIKAEMHEFILRNWRIVKVATTKAQRKLFFNLRSSKQRLGWLSPEETRSVARELGVPEDEVTRMEGRMAAADVSFDGAPDDDDGDARPAFDPVHYLEQEGANPEDILAAEDWDQTAGERLQTAIAALDPRSREIIAERWLQDGKLTLHDLAARHGVSAERIRQIEKAALRRLRDTMALSA
ncbi:MAG: RNA polymerase sigma factor RpoH [Gammaproteobacteria bacterium]|jgi:RNA polymerase sigma-32 factor